jgi:hypothetical protein
VRIDALAIGPSIADFLLQGPRVGYTMSAQVHEQPFGGDLLAFRARGFIGEASRGAAAVVICIKVALAPSGRG